MSIFDLPGVNEIIFTGQVEAFSKPQGGFPFSLCPVQGAGIILPESAIVAADTQGAFEFQALNQVQLNINISLEKIHFSFFLYGSSCSIGIIGW